METGRKSRPTVLIDVAGFQQMAQASDIRPEEGI